MEKLFYSIGEVAEMFDVNASLIRFWEKEFDTLLKPQKSMKGNRMFTQKDINHLRMIYHLVKEQGMTLEGAKKRLKENKDDVAHNAEVVAKLKSIRSMLTDLRNEL